MFLIVDLFSRRQGSPAPRYFFLLSIFVLLFLIMMFPIFPHLTVLDGKTNEVLYKIPVQPEKSFHIHFIHSIHLTPVDEFYEVTNDLQIELTELHFDTYSVGMPSALHEGETIELKDGKIMIKNMNRTFPYIDLRIGQVIANHQLMINDQTIQMSDIAPPGSWVRLKITKWNIFKLMGEVLSHEKGSSEGNRTT